MVSGPGSPFGPEDKAPCTSWIYRLPTNKKLEVWTQYRLLLYFLGGYISSFKNIWRQREICKKNPEIRKNPLKSQACSFSF